MKISVIGQIKNKKTGLKEVEADKQISEELKQEIEKDGVVIYEKA